MLHSILSFKPENLASYHTLVSFANEVATALSFFAGGGDGFPCTANMLRRHSSSSAIFERDIEPGIGQLHSHPAHPSNPHRTPRSKATEPIETSVPSVLDSAAALLTSTDAVEESLVAVEAPVSIASAMGSPIGLGSRSPSPSRSAAGTRTSMLLNLPSPTQTSIISPAPLSPASNTSSGGGEGTNVPVPQQTGSKSASPKALSLTTSLSASTPLGDPAVPGGFAPNGPADVQPGIETPSSAGASTNYESAVSSPTTTTREHPPHPLPATSSPMTPTAASFDPAQAPIPRPRQQPSHPPSPSNAAKRLSFLSYADMINSTPTSTLPLSSLTSPVTSLPPPHIPTVELSVGSASPSVGSGSRSVSAAASARTSLLLDGYSPAHGHFHHVHNGQATDVKEPTGGVGDDDRGGEWARLQLGQGLEAQLEKLLSEEKPPQPQAQ